jgi:hypothetical protein
MSVLLVLSALEPAASYVCESAAECQDQGIYTFIGTPDRVWSSLASLVSLVGVVVGSMALVRSRRPAGSGAAGLRRAGVVALVAGLIGAVNGAANLAVADGGLGTGNGVAGGAIALVLGLAAVVLGRRVLIRSAGARSRTADGDPARPLE